MPDHNKPNTTALTDAVTTSVTTALAGAGNPVASTIGDTIRRAVDAHGHNYARSAIAAIQPPSGLGLADLISAGAARPSDLTAAARIGRINETARSAMETFHRIAGPRAGEEFSGDRLASLGVDLTSLHNTDATRGLRGLAAPVVSAADHIAQMRSTAYPTIPAMGSWSDPTSEMRSAFQSAIPTMPAMPATSRWSELMAATRPPTVASAWSSAAGWLNASTAPGGHLTGLVHRLSLAVGEAGHLSAFDTLIQASQRTIRDVMGRSALIPDAASWTNDLLRGQAESITHMMRSLWPLVDRGVDAARLALHAALRVVGLLQRNDPRAPEAVKAFLLKWLNFRYPTWDLVTSATLVLMQVESWLPENIFTLEFDPRPKLRRLTLDEHRAANRLSTDPDLQFRLKPLLSLDQPISPSEDGSAPTAVRDLVPDRAAPDPADIDDEEFTDPRVLRLWWKLTDLERAILRERSQRGVTWASAAVAVGQPPSAGEKLRRKVKRLAAAEKWSNRADSQSAEAG